MKIRAFFMSIVLAITALLCFGCVGGEEKGYRLTVVGGEEYLLEEPEPRYEAGELVTVKVAVPTDVELVLYLDGVELGEAKQVTTENGAHEEYAFTMPSQDATLLFKVDGDISDNRFATARKAWSWFTNLQKKDMEYIELNKMSEGIASGALTDVLMSGLQADIDTIYMYLDSLILVKIDDPGEELYEGDSVRLTLYTSAGVHTVYEMNGYFCIDGAYYEAHQYIPEIEGEQKVLGFVAREKEYDLYYGDEFVKKCENVLGSISFTRVMANIQFAGSQYYKVQLDTGVVTLYGERMFSYETEADGKRIYQIVGGEDFSGLLSALDGAE